MIFAFYQLLIEILSWFIKPYLRKRAKRNAAYLAHWSERFGQPYEQAVKHPIWVHAVSVGETRAAQPLIQALQKHFPEAPLLLTQMTPTGRLTAQQLYPNAQCRYLPYDKAKWVKQFLQDHQPQFGVLMETEIWPNLIDQCHQQNYPIFLANARLSPKSAQGYQKIASLIQPTLQKLTGSFAQTQADAERLRQLGATNLLVTGNTKYDIQAPASAYALAQTFKQKIGERPVAIAASTRHHQDKDEAELILTAWAKQPSKNHLLILVPRHPERFERAYEIAQQLGLNVQKRSDNQAIASETQVWIGDSMGELFAYYLAADIAFVGGSLVDTGCQNIIEPISCSKPVLFGFSTYNFQAACESALAAGAAKQIQNADELVQTMHNWLQNPQQHAHFAQAAQQFIVQHQGASQRIADAIFEATKK